MDLIRAVRAGGEGAAQAAIEFLRDEYNQND